MALLSVALDTARTLLNDDIKAVWSDAALIPKAQEAHRELQAKLWDAGSPIVRARSDALAVAANAIVLTTPPADLLVPFKLMEYADSVETIADAVEMTEVFYLPTVAKATTLKYWAWRGEAIEFVGCTAARKVILFYRKLITIPAAAGDAIGITFGELFIAAKAAALAHGSLGNIEAAGYMSQKAEDGFAQVLSAQRGQQKPQSRP